MEESVVGGAAGVEAFVSVLSVTEQPHLEGLT
jgi:hypothetical protein